MKRDKQFLDIIAKANQDFSGWDFSYITGTGRMASQLLTWSYGSMAVSLVQHANSMLDMGTGGGEFLSMLKPLPKRVLATEGYLPNVPVARKRLEPLGVEVVQVGEDLKLPLEDNQFDLVLNRHEAYSAEEVRRVMTEDGIFLTLQSGELDCREINETFEVPLNDEYKHWNLETATREARADGFEVLSSKEEFPIQRFYDVGSLIYFLNATPWQVPGFETEKYFEQLYKIHQIIQEHGYFDVTQHRFFIKARSI
ncbi:class I SAM-dependent methyltransferase [Paenibacillus oleatilyticus]|uniref:class I SAM-dependent methyltransferase n=1 Tax=Paenibacillus oleatilyticus TaxID=2594886 RepID=UPI001C1F805F|nr:class I SAM-dependent methyltransferase [Paenibacillus oleatilyticus]MBU7314119.1 class I SAM-dependent methyltransferase [Paenibacillus oleatilyticus]